MAEPASLGKVCEQLRKGHPERTVVDTWGFQKGYGGELGRALLGNEHARTLRLELATLLPPVTHVNNNEGRRVERSVHLLLLSIRSNRALRHIELFLCGSLDPPEQFRGLVNSLLEAVTQNRHIQTLGLWSGVVYCYQVMAKLVSFGSLCSLELYIRDVQEECSALLADAFGENKSLHKLKLHHDVETSAIHTLELFFRSTSSSSSRVTEQLGGALACFLMTTSTLRQLKLQHYGVQSAVFSLGLASATLSLQKLSFHNCRFHKDAILGFQTWASANNSVTELELHGENFFCYNGFEVSVPLSLLTMPVLQSLTLSDYNDQKYLCRAMATHAALVQIASLTLEDVTAGMWEDLESCLALLVSLKSLNVLLTPTCRSFCHSSLSSLFLNGSLCSVSLRVKHTSRRRRSLPFWNKKETRHAQAFCLRNHQVSLLLLTTVLGPRGNDGRSKAAYIRSMVPHLFGVAQQAPRVAPTRMFVGLLSLGDLDTIGNTSSMERRLFEC
jgi:hypothetical protein